MKTLIVSALFIASLVGCASSDEAMDSSDLTKAQDVLAPADTADLREDDPMRNLEQAETLQTKGAHDDLTPEDYALDENDPAAGIPLNDDAKLMGEAPPARSQRKMKAPAEEKIPNGAIRVYYVKTSEAIVHERPKEGAKPVKTLMQGDNVMVRVQGEWGRITERQWIQLEDLTHIPVGRTHSADSTWLPNVK